MRPFAALSLLLPLLWLTGPAPAIAQAESAAPGINRAFENPEFERWRGAFEHPGREVFDRRGAIVAALALRPGMAVADIGAGTGLFTLLFAPAVRPAGRVYAVDISAPFVEGILARAATAGLDNVTGVVNTPTDVSLPPGSIDLAFVCNTYHHFEYPQPTLASIRRALRPGGGLVIVDFRHQAGHSSAWAMGHVRAGEEAVIAEVEAAGFRLEGRESFLRENYFLRFVKE